MNRKALYISIVIGQRRVFDFIFYIATLLYGNILMISYGKQDVGFLAILVVLSYLFMLLMLAVTIETIFITSDPINSRNVIRYRTIFLLKILEMGITHYFGVIINNGKGNIILYNLLIFVISVVIIAIHNMTINKYKNMNSESIEEMISIYTRPDTRKTDVDLLYRNFVYFMLYCIFQIFIYKYTLWRWEATIVFLIINIIILKKLFWQGCKDLYQNYKVYFYGVCMFSSIGIILMKLVYDDVIIMSIFRNRDEQELWMVFILFYIPLMRLGKDLVRRKKNMSYIWKK